jgi:hypothetical protein
MLLLTDDQQIPPPCIPCGLSLVFLLVSLSLSLSLFLSVSFSLMLSLSRSVVFLCSLFYQHLDLKHIVDLEDVLDVWGANMDDQGRVNGRCFRITMLSHRWNQPSLDPTDCTADPRSVPFLTISGNGGARRKSLLGL